MESTFETLKNAETGAITDAMRLAGAEGWMSGIFPANPKSRICGRAFTVQYGEVVPGQEPYNLYRLLTLAKPGDVIVVSADVDGAVAGENVMQMVANRALAGMVLDGVTRDYGIVGEMETPHFSKGRTIKLVPANIKPIAYGCPVSCGGVTVNPGDYIIGDIDGVVSLKTEDADKVAYQAVKVREIEKQMRAALDRHCGVDEIVALSAAKKEPRT